MLECHHFSHPTVLRWVYDRDTAVGTLLRGFSSINVGCVQTPNLQCIVVHHLLCSCTVWLYLWYGPRVWNKWSTAFFSHNAQPD